MFGQNQIAAQSESWPDVGSIDPLQLALMVLDSAPEAMFWTDARGYIVKANASGWKMAGDQITHWSSGCFKITQLVTDPWAKSALVAALNQVGCRALTLHRSDGARPYLVRIQHWGQTPPVGSRRLAVACLHFIDTDQRESGATNRLAACLGLTRAETAVAIILAQGASDQAIATRLAIKLSTVRSHVRSILSKAGALSRAAFAHRFTRML